MTSSNGTFRKSRAFTWTAGLAALATIGLLGFLVLKVSELEGEFGSLRDDKARIEAALTVGRSEVAELANSRDALRREIMELDGTLRHSQAASAELMRVESEVVEAREQLAELRAKEQVVQDSLATLGQAQADLSSTRDALLNAQTRLDALVSEVKKIEDRRARAEQSALIAERERNELVSKRDRLAADTEQLQVEVDRLERERNLLEGIEQELRTIGNNLAEAKSAAKLAEARLERAAEEQADLVAEIQAAQDYKDAIDAEVLTSRETRAALSEEVNSLILRRDNLHMNVAILEGRLREADGLQGRLDTMRQMVNQADTELQSLRGEIATEQERLDEVKLSRAISEARIAERQTRLESLEKSLAETESRLTDAEAQNRLIEAAADSLQERKHELLVEIQDLAVSRATELESLENARVTRAAVEGETAQRSAELSSLLQRIQNGEQRIGELQAQDASIRAEVSALEEQWNDIEAKLVLAQDSLAQAQSVLIEFRDEAEQERVTVGDLEDRNAELQRLISESVLKLGTLQKEVETTNRAALQSREIRDSLLAEVRDLAAERDEALNTIESARIARAAIEGQTAQRAAELERLYQTIEEEQNRINGLKTQTSAIREDLSVLEERRSGIETKRLAARDDLARVDRDVAAARAEAAQERAEAEQLGERNAEAQEMILASESQLVTLQTAVQEMQRTATESRMALDMLDQQLLEKRTALDAIEDEPAAPNLVDPRILEGVPN